MRLVPNISCADRDRDINYKTHSVKHFIIAASKTGEFLIDWQIDVAFQLNALQSISYSHRGYS